MSCLQLVEPYLDSDGELDTEHVKIYSRKQMSLKDMKVEMELTSIACVGRGIHSYPQAWVQSYHTMTSKDSLITVASKKTFVPILEHAYSVAIKDTAFADILWVAFKLHVTQLEKEIQLYMSSKKHTERTIKAERVLVMLLSRAYSLSSLVLESDPQNKNVTVMCFFSPQDAAEGTFTSRNVIIFSRSHNHMCHRLRHIQDRDVPLNCNYLKNRRHSIKKNPLETLRIPASQNDFGSLHSYNRMIPPFIDTFLEACQVTTEYFPVSRLFNQYCSFILSSKHMTNGLEAFVKRKRSFERYVADVAAGVSSKERTIGTRQKYDAANSVLASCSLCPDNGKQTISGGAVTLPQNMMLLCCRQLPETGCRAYNISLATRTYGLQLCQRFTDPMRFFDSFILEDGTRDTSANVPVARIFHSRSCGYCAVAKRDIDKGEIVCEYSGSLVSMGDFLANEAAYKLQPLKYPNAEYDGIEDGKVWDPYTIVEGNETRSITITENIGAWLNSRNKPGNGSKKVKRLKTQLDHDGSNCKVALCVHRGVKRLYVRALSDIPRSYELIQDYNSYWWE